MISSLLATVLVTNSGSLTNVQTSMLLQKRLLKFLTYILPMVIIVVQQQLS